MANTNGMRHPMTALEDGEFGGEKIAKGRVFDALTLDTVKKLKSMGVAAVGDLTEHQDLSVTALSDPAPEQVHEATTTGEQAPDGASSENTGTAGVNNVPAVPELQKSTEQANADAAANVPVVEAALREGGGKDPSVIGEAAPAAQEKVEEAPKQETPPAEDKPVDGKKTDDVKAEDTKPAAAPRVTRTKASDNTKS